MARDAHLAHDIKERLPIIPHENVADVDCCGCLIVKIKGGQADIVCNECAATIRTVPVGEVDGVMAALAETETAWSARCTHCGAVNAFPGASAVIAFVCRECGNGVEVNGPVQ
jgi:hypothetical protein